MLVGVHTQRWGLCVVGHIGKADTSIDGTLYGTHIRWRVSCENFAILHRAAEPDASGMTGRRSDGHIVSALWITVVVRGIASSTLGGIGEQKPARVFRA